jgi:hypothetical protein
MAQFGFHMAGVGVAGGGRAGLRGGLLLAWNPSDRGPGDADEKAHHHKNQPGDACRDGGDDPAAGDLLHEQVQKARLHRLQWGAEGPQFVVERRSSGLGACPINAKIEPRTQVIVLRSDDVYLISYTFFKNPITWTGFLGRLGLARTFFRRFVQY